MAIPDSWRIDWDCIYNHVDEIRALHAAGVSFASERLCSSSLIVPLM